MSAALAGWFTPRLFALSVSFATLASNAQERAPDETPLHLSYTAPASCPSRAEVLAQLNARAAHLVEARATETAPRFRIEVKPDERGVHTSVEMTLLNGAYSRRVVRTNDCEEAIAAATVIMALVLAPQRNQDFTGEGPAPQQQAPEAPSDDPNEQRDALADPPPRAPDAAADETPFQISAGGQLGAPATMFGATLGGGAFLEGQLYPEDWVSPSVRVAFLAQGVDKRDERDNRGTAELRLATGRLSVCPVRLPAQTRASLRPCALLELGRLVAQGTDTEDGREAITAWRALGVSLRGAWSFPIIALEIEGAAIFPLTKEAFYFDPLPVEPTFEVPWVHASVLIGLSVHWP